MNRNAPKRTAPVPKTPQTTIPPIAPLDIDDEDSKLAFVRNEEGYVYHPLTLVLR